MDPMLKRFLRNVVPRGTILRIRSWGRNITLRGRAIAARTKGVRFAPPNYIFHAAFSPKSTIVDVGCGFDADFSVYLIRKYGLKSLGVDPTLKHRESLLILEKKWGGRFVHVPVAVSASDGKITFHESVENVSGSIISEHKNVKNDHVRTYEVDSVSLKNLPGRLGLTRIEYIKLDLEGAEYDLLQNIKAGDVGAYDQIFIEFHHHCIPTFSREDTMDRVKKVAACGFVTYTLDGHNYLFYREH
jgi:FkbM family methyltransferase